MRVRYIKYISHTPATSCWKERRIALGTILHGWGSNSHIIILMMTANGVKLKSSGFCFDM